MVNFLIVDKSRLEKLIMINLTFSYTMSRDNLIVVKSI